MRWARLGLSVGLVYARAQQALGEKRMRSAPRWADARSERDRARSREIRVDAYPGLHRNRR